MLPSASGAATRASASLWPWSRTSAAATSAAVSRPNRSRMQRDRTVGSNAPGIAVVRMNIVPGGGSSSDLSSEFCAAGFERVGFADQHHAQLALERPVAGARQHVADHVDLDRGAVVGLERDHVDVHAARDAVARAALAARVVGQRGSRDGSRQLTAWAVAGPRATCRRPEGPANSSVGGSVLAIDRAGNEGSQPLVADDVGKRMCSNDTRYRHRRA